jgi:hypothetical protein
MDWSDYASVLAAVNKNGRSLQFADKTFKSNGDIVMASVKRNGGALQFADDTLKL